MLLLVNAIFSLHRTLTESSQKAFEMGASATLALWVLVMTIGTLGIIKTTKYKSVFVKETDVTLQSQVPAKTFTHCTSLYQKQPDSGLNFYRFDKETETCTIGEVSDTGKVSRIKSHSKMIEHKARPESTLGEFNAASVVLPNFFIGEYDYQGKL